jgi:hypothetical protein
LQWFWILLCLAQSCKSSYSQEEGNLTSNESSGLLEAVTDESKTKTRSAYDVMTVNETIMIPQVIDASKFKVPGSNKMKIRKILFCAVNGQSDTSLCHVAPDPALLVGKAASNCFKPMDLELLPGCDTDGDWDYGDDTDDGTISLRHEQILRGWSVSEIGTKIPTFCTNTLLLLTSKLCSDC